MNHAGSASLVVLDQVEQPRLAEGLLQGADEFGVIHRRDIGNLFPEHDVIASVRPESIDHVRARACQLDHAQREVAVGLDARFVAAEDDSNGGCEPLVVPRFTNADRPREEKHQQRLDVLNLVNINRLQKRANVVGGRCESAVGHDAILALGPDTTRAVNRQSQQAGFPCLVPRLREVPRCA